MVLFPSHTVLSSQKLMPMHSVQLEISTILFIISFVSSLLFSTDRKPDR